MQASQSLAWADNAIKLAVDMTVAAINRVNIQGTTEQQAQQIRTVMATVFPEAVTLVREARQGLIQTARAARLIVAPSAQTAVHPAAAYVAVEATEPPPIPTE